jgi:hypothetical protein
MTDSNRSTEKRLSYNWPVWFAEDFNGELSQGQMVDIASDGASFTCYADKCPYVGQQVTARFSVPRYGADNSFDLENFVRSGKIFSITETAPFVRSVSLNFTEPLPFKPGEVDDTEALETEETISTEQVQQVIAHSESVSAEKIAETEAMAMADIDQTPIEVEDETLESIGIEDEL